MVLEFLLVLLVLWVLPAQEVLSGRVRLLVLEVQARQSLLLAQVRHQLQVAHLCRALLARLVRRLGREGQAGLSHLSHLDLLYHPYHLYLQVDPINKVNDF